jgi:hypothetical protein
VQFGAAVRTPLLLALLLLAVSQARAGTPKPAAPVPKDPRTARAPRTGKESGWISPRSKLSWVQPGTLDSTPTRIGAGDFRARERKAVEVLRKAAPGFHIDVPAALAEVRQRGSSAGIRRPRVLHGLLRLGGETAVRQVGGRGRASRLTIDEGNLLTLEATRTEGPTKTTSTLSFSPGYVKVVRRTEIPPGPNPDPDEALTEEMIVHEERLLASGKHEVKYTKFERRGIGMDGHLQIVGKPMTQVLDPPKPRSNRWIPSRSKLAWIRGPSGAERPRAARIPARDFRAQERQAADQILAGARSFAQGTELVEALKEARTLGAPPPTPGERVLYGSSLEGGGVVRTTGGKVPSELQVRNGPDQIEIAGTRDYQRWDTSVSVTVAPDASYMKIERTRRVPLDDQGAVPQGVTHWKATIEERRIAEQGAWDGQHRVTTKYWVRRGAEAPWQHSGGTEIVVDPPAPK